MVMGKTVFTSHVAVALGISRATLVSDQLVTNSGVPTDHIRLDNSLEQVTELRKMLYLGLKFYGRKRTQIRTSQRGRHTRQELHTGNFLCPLGHSVLAHSYVTTRTRYQQSEKLTHALVTRVFIDILLSGRLIKALLVQLNLQPPFLPRVG